MTKLVILFYFIIISNGVYAQKEDNKAINSELSLNLKKTEEVPSPASTEEIVKDKNLLISSAARKSSITNNTPEIRSSAIQKSEKDSQNIKLAQARRPSTDSRPVQISIPVIPTPAIAKPKKMMIPNRRNFLPVGKS